MAIKGYFFNAIYNSQTQTYDREYNSEDMTDYLSLIVGGGVFPNPSTSLQVLASGTGMVVNVQAGSGWFADGHKIKNTAILPLTHDASDVLNNRIDRVVFYCDYINREVGIEIVKGTPAYEPVAPDLQRDGSRYEYSLALVQINAGVTTITQSMITDTRPDSSVCGWVAGLIQQVDTSTLFNQWETAYEEYYSSATDEFEAWEATQKSNFDAWLHDLTDELNVDTYVQNFEKSASFTSADTTKMITLDWSGYEYEVSDIINVYINGLLATAGTDYTLDTTGANPTVTFAFTGSSLTDVCRVQVIKSVIGFDTTP